MNREEDANLIETSVWRLWKKKKTIQVESFTVSWCYYESSIEKKLKLFFVDRLKSDKTTFLDDFDRYSYVFSSFSGLT